MDPTVDGWNPAPPRMMIIPLFIGSFNHPRWSSISSINSMDIMPWDFRYFRSPQKIVPFPSLTRQKNVQRKSQESIFDHGGINLLHLHLLKQMLVQIYFKKKWSLFEPYGIPFYSSPPLNFFHWSRGFFVARCTWNFLVGNDGIFYWVIMGIFQKVGPKKSSYK